MKTIQSLNKTHRHNKADATQHELFRQSNIFTQAQSLAQIFKCRHLVSFCIALVILLTLTGRSSILR